MANSSPLATIGTRWKQIIVFKTLTSPASKLILVPGAAGEPARLLRAAPLFLASTALLALAALALAADMPVARALARLDVPYELRHLVRLGEAFGWGGTVALLMLSAAILDRRGWRVVPRLAVLSFGSGLLADGIKLMVGRQRPFMTSLDVPVAETFLGWRLNLTSDDGVQSFPSAHAATAAGLAIGLMVLYPRGRWLFAALAALAAFQRLEVEAHFLSDVLAGASVGCLVGALCQLDFGLGRWFCKLEQR